MATRPAADEPRCAQSAPPRSGLLSEFGPGVISGAANDDPSCIVTYSMAGAALGYATLWTSLYLLPLIAVVQLMCSRLGMVGGRGLAGAVRKNYPKAVLFPVCGMLAVANVITLGADLGGMADVTHMVTGVPASLWTVVYAAGSAVLLLLFSYSQIQRVLKWLCLVLFAYVGAALLARPDWPAVTVNTLLPRMQWTPEFVRTLVAILGATVSPYFLFWQTSQEVEAEYCLGRRTVAQRRGATRAELERSKIDVLAGSFISKLITYCITITAAATLFAHGRHGVETAKDAALALQPVAGEFALWLFAVGIIGTGLLAVPVLAGSSAYAWSEAMRWRGSLEDTPKFAPKFYAVLVLSVIVGISFVYVGMSVVQMLFWASVINGLLAPVCILLVLLLTARKSVMGTRVTRPWMKTAGWASFAVSASAALALILTSVY